MRSDRHKAKQRARLAMALWNLLQPGPRYVYPFLPDHDWQACQRLARQILKAREHDWWTADSRATRELAGRLAELRGTVDYLSQRLTGAAEVAITPTPRELYQDIVSLEHEFETVSWDLRERTLSVWTEPIVLQGVQLGPFEIRLAWGDADAQPYQCLAVEPFCSAIDDSITHPHVQDGQLCEGNGKEAISKALETGRLLDFFVLVRSVLRTYNPASAYVTLDRWVGPPCADCDAPMSEYSERQCDDCERAVCRDCLEDCRSCGEGCCAECITSCSCCRKRVCSRCCSRCHRCLNLYCHPCIKGEHREACTQAIPHPAAQAAQAAV